MRRFLVWVPSLMVMLGVVIGAQAAMSLEDYTKLMKANAQAVGGMNKAIGSGAFADARMQVTTLRTNYVALQAFWAGHKKDDAVAIVKDGLTRLDAIDKFLGAATVTRWRRRPPPRNSAATPAAPVTSSTGKATPRPGSSSRLACIAEFRARWCDLARPFVSCHLLSHCRRVRR